MKFAPIHAKTNENLPLIFLEHLICCKFAAAVPMFALLAVCIPFMEQIGSEWSRWCQQKIAEGKSPPFSVHVLSGWRSSSTFATDHVTWNVDGSVTGTLILQRNCK